MKNLLLAVGTLSASAASLFAQNSVYLPAHREFDVSTSYVYESFDEFWAGDMLLALPDDITMQTVSVGFEYGITPQIAADITLGYVNSQFSPAPTLDGLNDTRFGIRWQFVDESAVDGWWPSLGLRVGGIIAGTYETVTTGAPNSPGDGASGMEASLLFGRALGETGLTLFGDFGYRVRAENVPEDLFGSAGLAWEFLAHWMLTFTYRHDQALSGLDIGGPGFDPSRFPETKEIQQLVEFGAGYTFSGGQHIHAFGAWTLDGRNTGDKTVLGVSLNFPF